MLKHESITSLQNDYGDGRSMAQTMLCLLKGEAVTWPLFIAEGVLAQCREPLMDAAGSVKFCIDDQNNVYCRKAECKPAGYQ